MTSAQRSLQISDLMIEEMGNWTGQGIKSRPPAPFSPILLPSLLLPPRHPYFRRSRSLVTFHRLPSSFSSSFSLSLSTPSYRPPSLAAIPPSISCSSSPEFTPPAKENPQSQGNLPALSLIVHHPSLGVGALSLQIWTVYAPCNIMRRWLGNTYRPYLPPTVGWAQRTLSSSANVR